MRGADITHDTMPTGKRWDKPSQSCGALTRFEASASTLKRIRCANMPISFPEIDRVRPSSGTMRDDRPAVNLDAPPHHG